MALVLINATLRWYMRSCQQIHVQCQDSNALASNGMVAEMFCLYSFD